MFDCKNVGIGPLHKKTPTYLLYFPVSYTPKASFRYTASPPSRLQVAAVPIGSQHSNRSKSKSD